MWHGNKNLPPGGIQGFENRVQIHSFIQPLQQIAEKQGVVILLP